MQCIACKQSIAVFRRVCPYCSYDQRHHTFPTLLEEKSETEDGAKEPKSHEVSMPEVVIAAGAATSDEFERYEFALNGSMFYVEMQRSLIEREHDGTLPERARDRFSLGYLSGLVDQWMQVSSVENESLRMTALAKVFENAFGSDWESCLLDALSHMHSGEASFMYGMSLGGNDAFKSIRKGLSEGGSMPKLTWAYYVSTGLHPG